jgi:hypothetical protein
MTRVLVHIGLSALLVIAPALCCCKARELGSAVRAAPLPAPAPAAPVHSCCVKTHSCCHDALPDAPKPTAEPTQHHQKPQSTPSSCACCAERPAAAQTESKPTVAAAEPTGELLPLFDAALVGSPEHFGPVRGQPPDRTGVDARSAALFERHVMRC